MIKKIKIFSIDKFKAKQRMFKVAFAGTIAAAVLSGCSSKFGSYETHIDTPVTYETNVDDYTNDITNTYEEIDLGKYNSLMDTGAYLDSEDVTREIENINNIKVTYAGSETFGIDAALANYNKVDRSDNSSNFSMTTDELVKIVKANNSKYLQDTGTKYYEELKDKDLEQVCTYIMNTVNYQTSNTSISTGNLQDKLNNLKVLSYSSFGYAFNNPAEDIIAVNMKGIDSIDKDNALERIISHESNHFLQADQNGDSYEYGYGTGYRFNDGNTGMQNEFLYEVSAESMAMEQLNDDGILLYENALRGLNAIKSSYILSGDALELEHLSFQNDINKVYDYFNCETEEDKMEILNMLNAYNLTKDFPSAKEYFEAQNMNTSAKEEYKNSLSSSIATTLSKNFYKDLAHKLENRNDYLLKDVFSVVRMQEMSVLYDRSGNSEEFVANYNAMQDELFNDIAENMGVDYQDIKSAYMEYVNSMTSYQPSSLLSEEENNYMNKQYNSIARYVNANTFSVQSEYTHKM